MGLSAANDYTWFVCHSPALRWIGTIGGGLSVQNPNIGTPQAYDRGVNPSNGMSPSNRDQTFRRLGYYLMGVALGCILVGIYFQGRRAQVAQQRAAQEQAARADAERAREAGVQPPAPTGPGEGAPR